MAGTSDTESTPSTMLDQNASTSGAPGITQAMPTMATSRTRRGTPDRSPELVIGMGGGLQIRRPPTDRSPGP